MKLSENKQLIDMKMYFKILNNLTSIDPATFFIFGPVNNVTRGHGCKIRKRVFSNNHLLNCFTNRAVDCWNALPEEVVNARSYYNNISFLALGFPQVHSCWGLVAWNDLGLWKD